MKWILSVVLCAVVTLGAGAQEFKVDHALDMSIQPTTPHDPDRLFLPRPVEELVTLSHAPPSQSRLVLRLLPSAQGSARWGEDVLYQVLVQNIGATTVILPWSADTAAFMQASGKLVPRGYRRASFTLEVQDAERRVLGYLPSASVYGSDEVPGSLLALAPGETARFTIPSRWATGDDAARRLIEEESSKGPVFWVATFRMPADGILSIQSINRLSFSAQH